MPITNGSPPPKPSPSGGGQGGGEVTIKRFFWKRILDLFVWKKIKRVGGNGNGVIFAGMEKSQPDMIAPHVSQLYWVSLSLFTSIVSKSPRLTP